LIVITKIEYEESPTNPARIVDFGNAVMLVPDKHKLIAPTPLYSQCVKEEIVHGVIYRLPTGKEIHVGMTEKVKKDFGFLFNGDWTRDIEGLNERIVLLSHKNKELEYAIKILNECLDNYKSMFMEKL
jgi:hypothetical protein